MNRIIKEYVLKRGTKLLTMPDGSYILDKVVRGGRAYLACLVDEDIEEMTTIAVSLLPKGNVEKRLTLDTRCIGSVTLGNDIYYVMWSPAPQGLAELLEEQEDESD